MRERICRALETSFAPFGLTPGVVAGWALALILFTPVAGNLVYYAALNADSRAVIGARDDDASTAIDVAGRSNLYRSNGFHPYGPVYFRIAHLLGAGVGGLPQPGGLDAIEARSKAMHFGLLLTSILSLLALSVLLAGAITTVPWAQLGLSTWFAWAFLKAEVWQTFLLRAHPDHLLALAVALATFATARVWSHDDVPNRRLAAWAWGVALSVKMTLLMWLPFLAASLIFPTRRSRAREAAYFAGHAALAFFVVGFPQNFSLHKIIRFLKQQSGLSAPATRESVLEWMTNYAGQLAWPLAVLLVGAGLTAWRSGTLGRPRYSWRTLALGFGPLGILTLQKVLPPHEHYPIPVVATQLALVAAGLNIRPLTSHRTLLGALLASLLFFSFVPVVPAGLGAVLESQLTCRPEARLLARRVDVLRDRGLMIHADPYVPLMSHVTNVHSTWFVDDAYLRKYNFDAFVISWYFAIRYVDGEPSAYAKGDNPGWARAVEFYGRFKDHDEVTIPELGLYRRTERGACGWDIWERVK